MMNEPPPRMLACLGLVSAVVCTGLVAVLLAYGRGEFDANYDVTAVFPSSSQGVFTDGATEVKVRGVPVGTVRGVRLLDDGRAEVTLRLDDDVQVPDTVEARLEPLSVFGPKFVDLVPGEGEGVGPFLDEGDSITRAATGTELTEVLDGATRLFQAVDPVDLVTVFDAVSVGVSGLGDTIGQSIDASDELVDVAHRRRDLVAPLLTDAGTVTSTIAARSNLFLERIQDYRTVAEIAAGRNDDLKRLLDATASIATRSSTLLDDAAAEFDLTVRSVAAVLRGVYDERERIPAAFDTVGAFFDMLGAGMRLPGPDGKKLTALKGFVTVDLCLVYGVCLLPEGGAALPPTPPLVGTPPAPAPALPVPTLPVPAPLTDTLDNLTDTLLGVLEPSR